MDSYCGKNAFLALVPFLTFLALYMGVGIWLSLSGAEFAFYQFPASSSALFGFGVALLIGWRRLNERVKTFTHGIGEETVVLMCLIFLLAGAFSMVTKTMGGVDATVHLGLYLLPKSLLVPGLFLIACGVSLAMGTSMGTISTVVPIAMGMAQSAHVSEALMVGAVVGGAMFGDNLSIISDTTVAATSSQGCDMRSKMLANLPLALLAGALTLVLLYCFAHPASHIDVPAFNFWHTVPYLVVLGLALFGMNVIVVLMIGTAFAALIGIWTDAMSIFEVGRTVYEGFLSMAEVFFLTVFAAGLAALVTKDGGLEYVLSKTRHWVRSKRSAEAAIAGFISLADICIANNTVAIILTGKMAKNIADEHQLPPARTASLLDIFSCVVQGILPYGAQLLLAGSLSAISPFLIMPYVWYPMLLGVVALLAIVFQWPRGQRA